MVGVNRVPSSARERVEVRSMRAKEEGAVAGRVGERPTGVPLPLKPGQPVRRRQRVVWLDPVVDARRGASDRGGVGR